MTQLKSFANVRHVVKKEDGRDERERMSASAFLMGR